MMHPTQQSSRTSSIVFEPYTTKSTKVSAKKRLKGLVAKFRLLRQHLSESYTDLITPNTSVRASPRSTAPAFASAAASPSLTNLSYLFEYSDSNAPPGDGAAVHEPRNANAKTTTTTEFRVKSKNEFENFSSNFNDNDGLSTNVYNDATSTKPKSQTKTEYTPDVVTGPSTGPSTGTSNPQQNDPPELSLSPQSTSTASTSDSARSNSGSHSRSLSGGGQLTQDTQETPTMPEPLEALKSSNQHTIDQHIIDQHGKPLKTKPASPPESSSPVLAYTETDPASDLDLSEEERVNPGYREWKRRRREWLKGSEQVVPKPSILENVPETKYPQLYKILVEDKRPLKQPINLKDAIKVLRAGWIENGTWPSEVIE